MRLSRVPSYVPPDPPAIGRAFLADPGLLLGSLLSTLAVAAAALAARCVLGWRG